MKTKNETIYVAYIDTPVGGIKIEATDRLILSLTFASEVGPSNPNDLCEEAVQALRAYFSGKRKTFDLPLKEASSAFAKKVYAETKKIPFGERRCYADIARAVGSPGAARAVGVALSKNPHIIAVPCHRVVYKDGSVGHYAGGDEKKRALLAFERGVS